MKHSHLSTMLETLRAMEENQWRGTGRSSKTIDQLREGDCLICIDEKEAHRYKGEAFIARGIQINHMIFENMFRLPNMITNWKRAHINNDVHCTHRVLTTMVHQNIINLMDNL